MKIVAGKKLKKVLILFLTLLLLPWEVTAASKNFKIIDPALYQDILKRTGISAEEVETYKDLFTAVENGETDKAAGLQKKLKNEVLLGHVLAEKYLHMPVEEREVYFSEVPDFAECGLCGTAAVISPVGLINDHGKEIRIPSGMDEMGPVLTKLYTTLRGIQQCEIEAPEGWILKIQ